MILDIKLELKLILEVTEEACSERKKVRRGRGCEKRKEKKEKMFTVTMLSDE